MACEASGDGVVGRKGLSLISDARRRASPGKQFCAEDEHDRIGHRASTMHQLLLIVPAFVVPIRYCGLRRQRVL